MTAQNRFYRPISEQDTQAGYVDISSVRYWISIPT